MSFRRTLFVCLLLSVSGVWAIHRDALACDLCALHPYSEETGSTSTAAATTLAQGAFSLGVTFEYRKWDELGHRNAHELHEEGRDIHNFDHDEFYHLAVSYGLTDDLEVGVTFPIAKKTFLRVEDGVVGQGDDAEGAGDLTVLGKYRCSRRIADLSLVGGIKFPTGDTAQSGFDGKKLEPEEVPGAGSFDYTVGAAIGKPIGRWSFGGDLLYTVKTEGAQGYEFGDVLRFDLSTGCAVRKPGQLPNARLTGEFNAQFLDKDKGRAGNIFDSGGQVFFVTPGVSVDLTEQTTMFFSMPVPVYQNRGGEHPEVAYGLIAGVSLRWG